MKTAGDACQHSDQKGAHVGPVATNRHIADDIKPDDIPSIQTLAVNVHDVVTQLSEKDQIGDPGEERDSHRDEDSEAEQLRGGHRSHHDSPP